MGGFSFMDFFFNICRSFTDFLHICVYLLIVIIAIIIALYKYDAKLYDKHVYQPIIRLIFKETKETSEKVIQHGRRDYRNSKVKKWSPASNRLPYYVRAIKNFFRKF